MNTAAVAASSSSSDVDAENGSTVTACSSCPICLLPINPLEESFLDQCFHRFCYDCITKWAKIVANSSPEPPASLSCPMCKAENFSIIHSYDGGFFQRDFINQLSTDSGSAFFTEMHKYRLQSYYAPPGNLSETFDILRFWMSLKYRQSNRWLSSWLRREIQALMQEEDVDIVLHHIHGVLDSSFRSVDSKGAKLPEEKQKEFKALVSDAARPFLAGRTDRFVDEVELFLASGLTLEAYDEVYRKRLGVNPQAVASDNPVEESSRERAAAVPYFHILNDDPDATE